MRSILSLACLLSLVPPVVAVDYDRIERPLKKEPAYQSRNPGYALLLFGREAQLRVWVVLDGETLYIDRNGDGDLTGKDERFASLKACRNVSIADPDGKTTYLIERVNSYDHFYTAEELRQRTARGIHGHLAIDVQIRGPLAYLQRCELQEIRDAPRKAHLAHFHGPLTIEVLKYNYEIPRGLKLKPEEGLAKVVATVGTMSQKHGCWVLLGSSADTDLRPVPRGVHPVVEIEFPSTDPKGGVIRKKYDLPEFC